MEQELFGLITKLRDETSFINSEKKHLIELYKQLLKKSEELFQTQWLVGRQHFILDDLILGRNKCTINQSCTKYSILNNHKSQFIESYKVLGHNDYYVSEFLKAFRDKPANLASLLVKSERFSQNSSIQFINGIDNQHFLPQQLVPIVFQSLYGNCVLKQDEVNCLRLLKHLMDLQFGESSLNDNNVDLRRLIRKQSCSFNVLFKLYTSFAYSAQLFLTASLYEPILQMLNDEWFLDIDPDKAMARFSTEERTNKFGHPSSKEYKLKTQKYREIIVNQLYTITMSFIDSINASLFCFPSSLSWLVSHLFETVNKSVANNPKYSNQPDMGRKLCCDLIVALYICPAICDPEPYGIISDIQISSVARHNLMQIANILQVLAMSEDDKDPKAQDLYSKFRSNYVSDILNSIITIHKSRNSTKSFADLCLNSNDLSNEATSIPSSPLIASQSVLNRVSILISVQELHKLLIYTRQIYKELEFLDPENEEAKWLKAILPFDYMNTTLENALQTCNSLRSSQSNNKPLSPLVLDSTEVIASILKENPNEMFEGYQIIAISIYDKDSDCPGMLSEEKVINEYENLRKQRKRDENRNRANKLKSLDESYEPSLIAENLNKLPSESGNDEIRSRLDGSVEGISEACETNDCPSLSSNDEDENNHQNDEMNQIVDGLSDFDNLSGRDTPIISGRDTPSSHSHEDLNNTSVSRINPNITTNMSANSLNQMNAVSNSNNNTNSMMNPSRGPQLPITVQKANREDINDKFCKFEINRINPSVREEQMSETGWSLDADPPESIRNEPISDLLGIEENRASTRSNISTVNNVSNNLVNLPSSNAVVTTSNTNGSTQADQENSIIANANLANTVENDTNLDDHYSVVSDTAAWSTDMITNSDSDLESNSPTKYTPYSTYSSNFSGVNSNASMISTLASMNNQQQQSDFVVPSSSLNNINSFADTSCSNQVNSNSVNVDLAKNSTDSGLNSLNLSTNNTNSISNNQSSSPSLDQSLSSLTGLASSVSQTIQHQAKSRFSSIFNSNSSVKFSLSPSSTSNSNNQAHGKRTGLQKIFPFKSKHSNDSTTNSTTSSPLVNPAVSTNISASSENQQENIDNIFKKYASNTTSNNSTKAATQQTNQLQTQNSISNEGILIDFTTTTTTTKEQKTANTAIITNNFSSNSLMAQNNTNQNDFSQFDSTNLDQSKLFMDAKKKLRIVLSNSDSCSYGFISFAQHTGNLKESFLSMYLKTQLYDAISLQDKEKEAQLYETMRCITKFNDQECRLLLRSLKKDYVKRLAYVTYLTKSKQSLIHSLGLVDKCLQRTEWHQKLFKHHLASVVARIFLEKKENEQQLFKFIYDFRLLVAVDEKFDLFKKFMQQLRKDYDSIWTGCTDEMIQLGYLCLERLLLSKVYKFVMFPNGEIDHYRDSKVSECLGELANWITPSHPLIGIAPIYLNECPWTAAQMELKRLNIYKTPQDKLACIRKCMLTIQNLLAIAKSPVCADDLHPVLIFVIIKANPPTFLSNVQYIEGFYGKELESEDYYWAQFMFAFSYIKANMINKVASANSINQSSE